VLKWIIDQGIGTAFIDPGKPWRNGVGESFDGKFRAACLSLEWFRSPAETKIVIGAWRRHFNTVRPHASIGYFMPAAFAAKIQRQTAAPTTAKGRGAPSKAISTSFHGFFGFRTPDWQWSPRLSILPNFAKSPIMPA
jgi:hypothetical protein